MSHVTKVKEYGKVKTLKNKWDWAWHYHAQDMYCACVVLLATMVGMLSLLVLAIVVQDI